MNTRSKGNVAEGDIVKQYTKLKRASKIPADVSIEEARAEEVAGLKKQLEELNKTVESMKISQDLQQKDKRKRFLSNKNKRKNTKVRRKGLKKSRQYRYLCKNWKEKGRETTTSRRSFVNSRKNEPETQVISSHLYKTSSLRREQNYTFDS